MSFTRTDWATAFLKSIGNGNPDPTVVNWVANWTKAETTTSGFPAYNLLNTTQHETGSTPWNGSPFQNFIDFNQGIKGTVDTIEQAGMYTNLLNALKTNNKTALGIGGVNNISGGVSADLNRWCGSCGYGNQFGASNTNAGADVFPGNGPSAAANGASNSAALAQKVVDWFSKFTITQAHGVNGEEGVDIGTPYHSQVESSYGGKVLWAGKTDWGNGLTSGGLVAIQTVVGGVKHVYYVMHLDTVNVKAGDTVNVGDILGLSGGQTSGGTMPTSTQYSSGPHTEEGFDVGSLLNAGNVHVGALGSGIGDPVPYLKNTKDIAATGTGGGGSTSSTSGGSTDTSSSGNAGASILDLTGVTNAINNFPQTLLASLFGSDYVQRSMLIFIGLTIMLIGLLVLFFSSGNAQTAAKIATAGA